MASVPSVHIIDDDEAVRDSLALLLEAHGLQVLAYASARAFLDAAPPGPGDCVVSDVMMPEMDGLDLLEALRTWPAPPPVILVAGRRNRALAHAAELLGAFAVIDKPYLADALLESVRAAMARTGAA